MFAQKDDSIHVLLIEDFDDARELFAEALQELGYDVTAVARGAEASSLSAAPDIILSDLGLPDCTGSELLESLRTLPGWDGVPAIAISGYSDTAEVQRARAAGFSLYLVKPVSLAEIDAAIQSLCGMPLAQAA